jgi:hypothetical protein
MKAVIYICLIAVASFSFSFGQSEGEHTVISEQEARQLLLAALPLRMKRLPQFGLEGGRDEKEPRFYNFTAYWTGLPNGSVVQGS